MNTLSTLRKNDGAVRISETIRDLRAVLDGERRAGGRVGFVPTMGFLHEGHLSLVDIAGRSSDVVVVSIYVNPLQFGPSEDFASYPRDLERDAKLARGRGVDVLFTPTDGEMYPEEILTFVDVQKITDGLCGASRPGHFRGVLTVVAKLLNIVQPDVAVFGRKDAQQAVAVRRMARDLNVPCDILIGPTVREEDGLALSSRNRYLSKAERKDAVLIHRALEEARSAVEAGERDASRLERLVTEILGRSDLIDVDYVSVVDTEYCGRLDRIEGGALLAVAAFVGKTRLIDNEILEV
jgi:pantoate--beta-alanine ligase